MHFSTRVRFAIVKFVFVFLVVAIWYLCITCEATSLILTHSKFCDSERTESQILSHLLSARKEVEYHRRRLLSISDNSDAAPSEHLQLTMVTSQLISSTYDRVKSERVSKAVQQCPLRRKLGIETGSLEHDEDDPWWSEDAAVGVGETDLIRLSKRTMEDRRDRLLSLLEVAYNAEIVAAASTVSDVNTESANYRKLASDYLPHLQIDIVKPGETTEDPSSLLLGLASHLPCLDSSPELDRPKVADIIPNDLRIKGNQNFPDVHQWGFLGKDHGEMYGANVVKAWESFSGSTSPGFVVAVIDTGCSFHPDLAPNLCPAGDLECGSYDFGDDDDNAFDDRSDHGTSVTSVIASQPRNDFGLSGVCWSCRIMCLKTSNSKRNTIELSSILKAYNYLIEKKVKLSNHSYTGYGWSAAEYLAISKLKDVGHLMVVAAGNAACNLDYKKSDGTRGCVGKTRAMGLTTPAGYDLDNILAVGSVDRNGSMSDFSNWGRHSVDLMAAGRSIPVLVNTLQHKGNVVIKAESGTSFAAPLVTGVASLVWGRNPRLKYQEVKNIIMASATPLTSLKAFSRTGGILNAAAAVAAVPSGSVDVPWMSRPTPTLDDTSRYYGFSFGYPTTPVPTPWTSFVVPGFILFVVCPCAFILILCFEFIRSLSVLSPCSNS